MSILSPARAELVDQLYDIRPSFATAYITNVASRDRMQALMFVAASCGVSKLVGLQQEQREGLKRLHEQPKGPHWDGDSCTLTVAAAGEREYIACARFNRCSGRPVAASVPCSGVRH
jgi:hypothetical protein